MTNTQGEDNYDQQMEELNEDNKETTILKSYDQTSTAAAVATTMTFTVLTKTHC
jgi:hypothetical protein